MNFVNNYKKKMSARGLEIDRKASHWRANLTSFAASENRFILTDNTRILCLSCNVSTSKTILLRRAGTSVMLLQSFSSVSSFTTALYSYRLLTFGLYEYESGTSIL